MDFLNKHIEGARTFLHSWALVASGPGASPPAFPAELDRAARRLEELLSRVRGRTYFRAGDLEDIVSEADRLARLWPALAVRLRDDAIAAAGAARLEAPYPLAECVWREFDARVPSPALPGLDRGKAQALLRKARDPYGLVPLVRPSGVARLAMGDFVALDLFCRLARHTPLPQLDEKTVWQIEDEATRGGGSAEFRDLLSLSASPRREDRLEAEKIVERLRSGCSQERWRGSEGEPSSRHRSLAAFWRDIRASLRALRDPAARRAALKPALHLRCTFIIDDYFPEVKEFILEGLADRDGRVRRAVARFAHDVFLELRENPALARELGDVISRTSQVLAPHLPGHAESARQALSGWRERPQGGSESRLLH